MNSSMRFTIATGNPRTGFTLTGLFETMEDAHDWGTSKTFDGEWTIMQIMFPDNF